MQTCGTCRFIKREERELTRWDDAKGDEEVAVFHVCGRLAHLNHYRDEKERKLSDQVAGIVDGSGYFAALCVTDEFGCNQWEKAALEPGEQA